MTTAAEIKRGVLTDEQLLERAERAGWEWFENVSGRWPASERYPATGWLQGEKHFQHCTSEQKIDALRANVGNVRGSVSPGFDHEIDCVECGKPVWLHWLKSCEEELTARRECWDCNFWLAKIRRNDSLRIVMLHDGKPHHYTIGSKTSPGNYNGFGGSWWTLRKTNGAIVKTCDLWHQGDIPERFWARLPVNAEQIPNEDERTKRN